MAGLMKSAVVQEYIATWVMWFRTDRCQATRPLHTTVRPRLLVVSHGLRARMCLACLAKHTPTRSSSY